MANTYTLIASNVLSTSAASVTFSAIPNTYTDLVLKCSVRNDTTTNQFFLELNGNTSTQYSMTGLAGYSTSTDSWMFSTTSNPQNYFARLYTSRSSDTANTFGSTEVYIPNYNGSTNKPLSIVSNQESNSDTLVWVSATAGLYVNTTAITSLKCIAPTNFVSGSSFFLYGLKSS